jgi:alpha-tubulin suppressor-like RCC1 family protein
MVYISHKEFCRLMNINNLQIQLQTAVNNAAAEATTDGTSSTLYYLQLAKAIQALNMGQIRTVADFASLPAAASSGGWLVFVTDEERLYFSNSTSWATIAPALPNINTIWGWGMGSNGPLGNNCTACQSSPVSVVGGFTDWCQISAGGSQQYQEFSLAVRTNGTAWAWGYNNCGQLGDNTVTSRSSPVSVVGGFTDWSQVSAGKNRFSLGVRTNGTAWAWGQNCYGSLGDCTTTNRSSPVSVVGGFTDWCQVSAGAWSSLGLRTNGAVWAWGAGGDGRLGDNTTVNKSSPVSVVGGFTDWCQISNGSGHALAVRTNGTAWTWGEGDYGKGGDDTISKKSSPVSVVGGFTDWCQVSAASQHSMGVRQNGTAWAWGAGTYGRLGDNTTVSKRSPVSVVGGFTDWCQVAAAYRHSLAVRTNGTAWAWGSNNLGRLGDGTTVSRSSPVSVVGGFTDWSEVSGSGYHSIGLRSTPQV